MILSEQNEPALANNHLINMGSSYSKEWSKHTGTDVEGWPIITTIIKAKLLVCKDSYHSTISNTEKNNKKKTNRNNLKSLYPGNI